MATKRLPTRVSLEYYRKQAKTLLKAFREGDAGAAARVRQGHPKFARRPPTTARHDLALSDAQWITAREHGFESWLDFANHLQRIEAAGVDDANGLIAATQLAIGPDEDVYVCAFSSGREVLTGGERGPVSRWDRITGTCLRTFEGHTARVWAVAYSPDGRRFMSGAFDNTMRLWDVAHGTCVRVFQGHTGYLRSAEWSPDGTQALSGSGDQTIRLWDVDSGECVRVFEGHTGGVYHAVMSQDRSRLLSAARDHTVRVWNVATGECLHVLKADHVQHVAWATDMRRALTSGPDIQLWDTKEGRRLRTYYGHAETIRSVAWSADQRRILSASHDGTVRLWDVRTGICERVWRGHSAGVAKATWTADERAVLSCDWQGRICEWTMS